MDSILDSIKGLFGIAADVTHFDPDIIMGINTGIMTLTQLGVGPSEGFLISNSTAKWSDFIGDRKDIEGVKTYLFLNTKLTFDTPTNSYLVEAINRKMTELEWRLNVNVDKPIPVIPDTTVEEGGL
jgi:hypothetical protein